MGNDVESKVHQLQGFEAILLVFVQPITFKDWVGLKKLVLDGLALPGVARHGGDVLHHELPRLRLARPALARQHDRLVLAPVPQPSPSAVSQGVAAT